MIAKLTIVLLAVVAVSANPGANGPWRWIHRQLTVSPNIKNIPLNELVIDPVRRPTPEYVDVDDIVGVTSCGYAPMAPTATPAIVGGHEAYPHSYPWQVALYIDNMYFCGGSIISNQWVMTAAHCMDGANFVDVVAGAHDLSRIEASQVTLRSYSHFVHENWNSRTLHNDIAMIKLPQTLRFNNYIQPVCLPSSSERDLGAGYVVTSTGWGKTSDFGSTSDTLNAVDDPTLANSRCSQYYGSTITSDQICIDGSGGKGTCNGDSGGPLNYKIGGITETRGIVSFGSTAGCTSGYPDAFTRVTHYLGWIKSHTGVYRP